MAEDEIWFVTAPKGGRRRAGRRWDEGDTPVPPEEQNEDLWKAVEGDDRMMIRSGPEGARNDDSSAKARAAVEPAVPVPASVTDAARAIHGLKAGDYTVGGKPKAEAIVKALGGEVSVSAKLRDEAFIAAKTHPEFTLPEGVRET